MNTPLPIVPPLLLAAVFGVCAGPVTIHVTEEGRQAPLPCRIHLRNAAGEPVRAPGLPFWRNHFVCEGTATLDLAPGTYHDEIDRGPEYHLVQGEVIRNGEVVQSIAGRDWSSGRALRGLTFEVSGWYLVRALASVPGTFRFASTGPFYVEVGQARTRISRASARFFLDWVRERKQMLALESGARRDEVTGFLDQAEAFWQQRLTEANAE